MPLTNLLWQLSNIILTAIPARNWNITPNFKLYSPQMKYLQTRNNERNMMQHACEQGCSLTTPMPHHRRPNQMCLHALRRPAFHHHHGHLLRLHQSLNTHTDPQGLQGLKNIHHSIEGSQALRGVLQATRKRSIKHGTK